MTHYHVSPWGILPRLCPLIRALGWLTALACTAASATAATAPLRVALIAGAEPAEVDAAASLARLRSTLEQQPQTSVAVTTSPPASGRMPSLVSLRTADVAVLYGGSGRLASEDAALLRDFLDRGKGLVVVRERTADWATWPDFVPAVLGAKREGSFANGAPMQIINLFGHAIFTGVARIETQQQMPLYADLTPEALLVIEGTVGEATAPLGWLRRTVRGRVAHLLPASRELFQDPAYLRLLANTVRWTVRQPIPGARAIVQRTYLPNAYPGAIAITFPAGPTVCFDPVRGGISQVADADFVDLRPRWLTKRGEPARIAGPLYFQDDERGSFWRDAGGAEPAFQFKGFSVKGEYPEFFYRVGERDIREVMRPAGPVAGIIRELHIAPGQGQLTYAHEPQSGAEIATEGGSPNARGFAFGSAAAGTVTMAIRPSGEATP